MRPFPGVARQIARADSAPQLLKTNDGRELLNGSLVVPNVVVDHPRRAQPEKQHGPDRQFHEACDRMPDAIRASSLSPAAKVVAWAMLHYTNRELFRTSGRLEAWPPKDLLAIECGMS